MQGKIAVLIAFAESVIAADPDLAYKILMNLNNADLQNSQSITHFFTLDHFEHAELAEETIKAGLSGYRMELIRLMKFTMTQFSP